jgi:hypothetical protein
MIRYLTIGVLAKYRDVNRLARLFAAGCIPAGGCTSDDGVNYLLKG